MRNLRLPSAAVFVSTIVLSSAVPYPVFAGPGDIARLIPFEEAVGMGTSVKGCPKKLLGRVENAYITDANGNPHTGRPGQSIFLVLSARGDQNPALLGPLQTTPTQEQLASINGRRICTTPD